MIFFNLDRTGPAIAQARSSVQILMDNADRVYSQGEGASIITTISVPQYCTNITTQNTNKGGEIIFYMQTPDGQVEVYEKTIAPLNATELFEDSRKGEFLGAGLRIVRIELNDDFGEKVINIESYE